MLLSLICSIVQKLQRSRRKKTLMTLNLISGPSYLEKIDRLPTVTISASQVLLWYWSYYCSGVTMVPVSLWYRWYYGTCVTMVLVSLWYWWYHGTGVTMVLVVLCWRWALVSWMRAILGSYRDQVLAYSDQWFTEPQLTYLYVNLIVHQLVDSRRHRKSMKRQHMSLLLRHSVPSY